MNKVKEIILSYATAINPTEEQKEVAETRLQTCMNCEFWTENMVGIQYCAKCGCATKVKVFSPVGQQACPENKWTI